MEGLPYIMACAVASVFDCGWSLPEIDFHRTTCSEYYFGSERYSQTMAIDSSTQTDCPNKSQRSRALAPSPARAGPVFEKLTLLVLSNLG